MPRPCWSPQLAEIPLSASRLVPPPASSSPLGAVSTSEFGGINRATHWNMPLAQHLSQHRLSSIANGCIKKYLYTDYLKQILTICKRNSRGALIMIHDYEESISAILDRTMPALNFIFDDLLSHSYIFISNSTSLHIHPASTIYIRGTQYPRCSC